MHYFATTFLHSALFFDIIIEKQVTPKQAGSPLSHLASTCSAGTHLLGRVVRLTFFAPTGQTVSTEGGTGEQEKRALQTRLPVAVLVSSFS